MEPTLLDSIAAPPATDIELTTVVAFAAGVLLWVRGAKLTESATLILGLAGQAENQCGRFGQFGPSDPQQDACGKGHHGGQFNVGGWRGSDRIEQSWFHEVPPMTDIGVGVPIP